MICTKLRLKNKLKQIRSILLDNGYPESIIDENILRKLAQSSLSKKYGPQKCPIYLRIPWIGNMSAQLDENVKMTVENCCCLMTACVVFPSKSMLPVAHKDALLTSLKSSVIYEYSCHCNSQYVGRTSQQ